MTGERELPAGDWARGGELEPGGLLKARAGRGLAPGAKNPTWRTLGSMTEREGRRASMGAC